MPGALLTDLELMILLAVLRRREDAYGVTITREIEETGGRSVAVAVVYATLDRLKDRGLVTRSVRKIRRPNAADEPRCSSR